jgi:3-phytase/alkaline phosphatase D
MKGGKAMRIIRLAVVLLLVCVLVFSLTAASPSGKVRPRPRPHTGRLTVTGVENLGMVTFDTGYMFADTEVGGLSGITYDAARGVYYVLSDDRSERYPARYYTADIDISDGHLDPGDVAFLKVTTLLDKHREPFVPGSLDPEGIVLAHPGFLFISSEGDANISPPTDPFVNRFNPNGKQTKALPVPDKFLPDGEQTWGVRDNLAFEPLTVSPDRRYLYTAVENALVQDGPKSTLVDETLSRVLRYKMSPGRPGSEFVFVTSAIPKPPDPAGGFADNGLVELAALDNAGTLLALERSFAVGVGNTVKLFETSTQGATDVSGIDALWDDGAPVSFDPMPKRLVVDFEDLDISPDNLEGMTLGPMLPDGRYTLFVVSDNNFNPSQTTQFIALALTVEEVPCQSGSGVGWQQKRRPPLRRGALTSFSFQR